MSLHAQVMPFKNYGVKDGLNDNNVQALVRDDRGLLWVGTDFGVYWFDGKKFYQPPIKSNVGQLYVNNFYADTGGVIWVLTFFNGVYKYQNGAFTNYFVDTASKDATINTVTQMSRLPGGNYGAVCNSKAYLFDGRKFTLFDSSNALLSTATNYITQLNGNTVAVCGLHGIFIYRLDHGRFRMAAHVLNGLATSKILLTGKQSWVVTGNGLMSYDIDTAMSFSKPSGWYLAGKVLKDAATDKNGNIWLLADTVYKIENGQLRSYTNANGLQDNIQSIYCDNEGIIWFANNKGISMLGDEYYEFTLLKSGVNEDFVGSVSSDLAGNIWIGTNDGLAIKKNAGYVFINNAGKNIIGHVTCLHKDRNGSLLAATDAGVISVDEKEIVKEINCHATTIAEDETGRIWLGDNVGNIMLFNGTSLTAMNIEHFRPEMITCLFIEHGNVWAGYRGSGIRKYRLNKDRLTLTREYNAANGFNDLRIRCCAADKKGNIIFGTRTNGIFIFSTASDTLVAHISLVNGLNANWIKDILCDSDGTVYLATNNGINILSGDYKKPVVSQLKLDNEHLNRETNGIFKSGNVFYIGANEGILKWMPDKMRKDTVAPPVYFTHIDIPGHGNLSVNPYTADAGAISLPYDQHIISLEFSGISLKNPENVRYQYMLEGQDADWGPVTGYYYVSYNLKPGDYTFKVIAKNADGKASRQAAVFHFVIKPPFWNSWWFIACVIAIMVMVIMLVNYAIYRYKLNQFLVLEQLRNKISTDLHDDIGSTLSSISILSDMAIKEPSQTHKLGMIKGIKENSASLLEKMDDIVWSINPKNDSFENLVERMRRFAAVLLEAKNIEYTIEVEPSVRNIKLSMDYRQHIYMMLKEAINNLVKYSECARAYICVTYHNNDLEITVKDNGIGFDLQTAQYGNGILNMRRRAKQMNAEVVITSEPGRGTEMRMRLKIK